MMKYETFIRFRCSEEMKGDIKKIAEADGIKMSRVVRRLLSEILYGGREIFGKSRVVKYDDE